MCPGKNWSPTLAPCDNIALTVLGSYTQSSHQGHLLRTGSQSALLARATQQANQRHRQRTASSPEAMALLKEDP